MEEGFMEIANIINRKDFLPLNYLGNYFPGSQKNILTF